MAGTLVRNRRRQAHQCVSDLVEIARDRRVEFLLPSENGRDEPPHELREAPAPAGPVGRRLGQNDGAVGTDLHVDGNRRRASLRGMGERRVDARQSVVVAAIRGVAFGDAAIDFALAHRRHGTTQ